MWQVLCVMNLFCIELCVEVTDVHSLHFSVKVVSNVILVNILQYITDSKLLTLLL